MPNSKKEWVPQATSLSNKYGNIYSPNIKIMAVFICSMLGFKFASNASNENISQGSLARANLTI